MPNDISTKRLLIDSIEVTIEARQLISLSYCQSVRRCLVLDKHTYCPGPVDFKCAFMSIFDLSIYVDLSMYRFMSILNVPHCLIPL